MALFCSVIRKDSVFLVRFTCLSHVKVFSWEISLFCRLKYPYNFLSSHFCFLVIVVLLIIEFFILFLVTVISVSLLFYSFLVIVSMYRRYIQCWRVLILLLFLTHRVCPYHLWEVRPNASLLAFYLSGPFVVIPSSYLRMVPIILRKGQPRCLLLLLSLLLYASFSH